MFIGSRESLVAEGHRGGPCPWGASWQSAETDDGIYRLCLLDLPAFVETSGIENVGDFMANNHELPSERYRSRVTVLALSHVCLCFCPSVPVCTLHFSAVC